SMISRSAVILGMVRTQDTHVTMTRSAVVKTLLAEAVALHGAGRFGEAHDTYQRVLVIDPREMDAVHGLALLAVDAGRPAEAIPLLAGCIALKPDNILYR